MGIRVARELALLRHPSDRTEVSGLLAVGTGQRLGDVGQYMQSGAATPRLVIAELDLGGPRQVERFADEFLASGHSVDIVMLMEPADRRGLRLLVVDVDVDDQPMGHLVDLQGPGVVGLMAA